MLARRYPVGFEWIAQHYRGIDRIANGLTFKD